MLPGRQIILDLYNCDFDRLNDQADLLPALEKIMADSAMPALSYSVQPHDEDGGFSIAVFHRHGHVVIHTFPATGFATADVFSAAADTAVEKVSTKIKQILKSERNKNTILKRGDFGSLNDMRPTMKRQIKAWRRVRNTSAKMLSMLKNKTPPSID
ncbi:MAG: S-adenosylmethionine decarboxylase [Acidaminococcales bacterium]|jgi:S-adenosylmethionine decarboxylase|nr:S-adenosylmethionine decarboxylase [Acidaminococcales bacterium]